MPRSLLFLQWLRVLQAARLRQLGLQGSSAHLSPLNLHPRHQVSPGSSMCLASPAPFAFGNRPPDAGKRVAVVGAGLAGLSAAYHLRKAGVPVQVYESSDRVGGRIRSVCGAVADGVVSDLGGELVNSDHHDLRALLREMHIELKSRDIVNNDDPPVGYFFAGARLSDAEVADSLRPFAAQIMLDAQRLDEDWDTWGPHFDKLSLAEYLQRHTDCLTPPMRQLIEALVRVEYGVEPESASCLQLLYLLPVVAGEHVELLSCGDEAWVIDGGSERLVLSLYQQLGDRVQTGKKLGRVQAHEGGFTLTFNQHEQVFADYVILALPLPALRQVDLQVDLPSELQRFIREVEMGRNEKFIMGCHRRTWRHNAAFATECWNDGPVSLVWDSSVRELSSTVSGALTFFMSGKEVPCGDGDIEAQGQALSAAYAAMIPGLQNSSNGRYIRTAWHTTEGIMGGYTNLKPGQYTGFASRCMYVEAADPQACQNMQVGRLLFAGEHTSDEYYGFMNGAAQTARLAATWVLRDLCAESELTATACSNNTHAFSAPAAKRQQHAG